MRSDLIEAVIVASCALATVAVLVFAAHVLGVFAEVFILMLNSIERSLIP